VTNLFHASRFVLFLFVVLGMAVVQAQTQFVNASFETPARGFGSYANPTDSVWTFSGASGVRSNVGQTLHGHHGVQVAYLSGAATAAARGRVSQTVNFATPGLYQLRFLAGGGGSLSVSVGGVVVDTIRVRLNFPDTESWWTQPFTIATAGNYEIAFAQETNPATAAVDNVVIVSSPAAITNASFEQYNGSGVPNGWSVTNAIAQPASSSTQPTSGAAWLSFSANGSATTTVTVPAAGVYSVSIRQFGSDTCGIVVTDVTGGGSTALATLPFASRFHGIGGAQTSSSFSLPAGARTLRFSSACARRIDSVILNRAGPTFANANFEVPALPAPITNFDVPWQSAPAGASWTFSGVESGIQATPGGESSELEAEVGLQFGRVRAAGHSISQTVTLDPGTYVLVAQIAIGDIQLRVNGAALPTIMKAGGTRLVERSSDPFVVTQAGAFTISLEPGSSGSFAVDLPRLLKIAGLSPPTTALALRVDGSLAPSTVPPGGTLEATATATDPDGLQRIRVLRNGVALAPENTAVSPASAVSPLTVTVSPLMVGNYTFTAEATDHQGAVGTASQTLLVNTPPTISLTGPSGGLIVNSVPLALQATASDADSAQTIAKVQFYDAVGGVPSLLGEITNPPATSSLNVTNPKPGVRQLFARAIDSVGGQTDSAISNVTVSGLLNGSFEIPALASGANCTGSGCTNNVWQFLNTSGAVAPTISGISNNPAGSCRVGATAGTHAAFVQGASPAGRIRQDVYLTPGLYDLFVSAQRTSAATHSIAASVAGSAASTFALTTTYATYQGAAAGYNITTPGVYPVIIDSTSTNTAAVACVEEVKLVLRNAPPTISSFTATPNGGQQAPATNVALSATAADPDATGYVASIEFLINGASATPALICTNNATSPTKPFICNQMWAGAVAGINYSITARVIDNNAASSISAPIALAFNRPPTATFTSPSSNAQLAGPNAVVQLRVTTSDPDGDAISKVEFYNGATLLGTVTAPQSPNVYALPTAPLAAGNYTITTKVYDVRGGSTLAPLPSVNFTVKSVNDPPVATLATVPAGITTVPFGTTVNFTASATDSDSGVSLVSIVDTTTNTVLGTCSYIPPAQSVGPCPASLPDTAVIGNHAIVAKAADAFGGGVAQSAAININVTSAVMTCNLALAPNPPNVGAASQLTANCVNGSTPIGGVTYAWSANTSCSTSTVASNVNIGTCSVTPASTAPVTYEVTATKVGYTAATPSASLTVTPVVNFAPKIVTVAPTTNLIAATPVSVATTVTDNLAVSSVNGSVVFGATSVASNTTCSGLGTTSADCSIAWTPTQAGIYTVTVTSSDAGNASSSAATTVAVGEIPGTNVPSLPVIATAAVGTTAGQFAVSESGAATYNIPIQVPAGINGVQPNLALVYNSQGGDGHVGVGWGLSGTSYITRCPKTIATDGVREAINYDNDTDGHSGNDAFCLDGQRLVPVGGIREIECMWPPEFSPKLGNPKAVTCLAWEFRTEIDSYSRIIALGDNAVAYSKNGDVNKYSGATQPIGFEPNGTPFYLNGEPFCLPEDATVTIGDTVYCRGSGPTRFTVFAKSGQVLDYGSRWWGISHRRPDSNLNLLPNWSFEDTNVSNSCWLDGSPPCASVVRACIPGLPDPWGGLGTPSGYFKDHRTGASESGWVFTDGGAGCFNGAGVQRTGSTHSQGGVPIAPSGLQTAFIYGRGEASTTLRLEKGAHRLTFKLVGRGYWGDQSIEVRLTDVFTGMVHRTYGPFETNTGDEVRLKSIQLDAPYSGTFRLTFAGTTLGTVTSDQAALLDEVKLVPYNYDRNAVTLKVFPLDRVEDRNGNYMHIDYGGTHQEIQDVDGAGNPINDANGNPVTYSTLTGSYGSTTVSTRSLGRVTVARAAAGVQGVVIAQGARPELEMFPRRFTYGMRTETPGAGLGKPSAPGVPVEISRVILNYESRTDVSRLYDTGSGTNLISKRLKSIRVLSGGNDDTSTGTDRLNFHLNEGSGSKLGSQCLTGVASQNETMCGTLVREYLLAYDQTQSVATGRSRLGSVTECSGDGSCLLATTFSWQNGARASLNAF
jgi:Bacterial Ig domain/Salmonella virulence plasmid 65kDa B protein